MAQRIETESHYEATPTARFTTGNSGVESAQEIVDTIIDVQGMEFINGFGGGPGHYEGLDERVQARLGDILPNCDTQSCVMKVDARVGQDSEVTVSLNCGTISSKQEDTVDTKEAVCQGTYERCKKAVSSWIIQTEMQVQISKRKICEQKDALKQEEQKLREIT